MKNELGVKLEMLIKQYGMKNLLEALIDNTKEANAANEDYLLHLISDLKFTTSNYTTRYEFPKIYCPWLPVGSKTNISEDSIGGIMSIVTHDINCPRKAYGWEKYLEEHRPL